MALKATIFKAELTVSDLDRGHFATHALTLARHPSETDERMMVRLLAFALNADERLDFGRGLSGEDEADLRLDDLTGAIDLWIDVGLPDERAIRKASGRARRVAVYAYGTGAQLWWRQNAAAMGRLANATVVDLPVETTRALAARAARNMKLQCTIQEGHVWLADDEVSLAIEPRVLQRPARD
ncbi:MAG: YaeQ family protein [Burkholderiales bacterium]